MGVLNYAWESNNFSIDCAGKLSKVQHAFLKSFRGKTLEGEHGVCFGENEKRENDFSG